jgi:competence ComEA-like helix-hairpin-helix protein
MATCAKPLSPLGWRWLLILALCPATALFAQQKTGAKNSEAKWEILEGCRLVTNSIVDGDSFHVTHQGREYIFRLYFVDAPEGDATLTERAREQAAYFGISPKDIPRAGKLAAQFTREALSAREFKVITRWRNAMGRSTLARFYAVVLVNGKNLAEELVAHGHARIYGLRANWPDGPRSTTFINKLKNLELTAREQKRGVWNEKNFPRETGAALDSATSTNSSAAATGAPGLVDLNAASFEELQKLPGIGPKMAERIMAHRPYEKLEDLDQVPGIGPKTIERLRPLVQVTNKPQ